MKILKSITFLLLDCQFKMLFLISEHRSIFIRLYFVKKDGTGRLTRVLFWVSKANNGLQDTLYSYNNTKTKDVAKVMTYRLQTYLRSDK